MPAVQQRVWYQQAAIQDIVLAAVGQVVGQFNLKCLQEDKFSLKIGNCSRLFAGLEKEKNEDVGKKVDLEAKTEAAEAAPHLLWSELACNSVEISPCIFMYCHHLFS